MRRVLAVAALIATTLAVVRPASAGRGPNDPGFAQQWALETIGAPDAWSRGVGEGMTIAVVDSGVDLDHPDLAGKIDSHVSCIGSGGDPANCDGSGQDDHGHGTWVAGVAAAATGNGRGIAAVAPEARLMAVRVLAKDDEGGARGSAADVRAGIRWAVDHGADVVNLSLGGDVIISGLLGSSLTGAVEYAWDHGVVTVAAAGNTGDDRSLFGSEYSDVPAVVVTATNRGDDQASYASDVEDARWGMAAPGGEGTDGIVTTSPHGTGYESVTGTSMAAPHVAGAAAVLRALGLSPQATVDRLLESAADVGPPGDDPQTGAGRLAIAAATEGFPARGSGSSETTTSTGSPRVSTTTMVVAPGPGEPRSEPPEEEVVAGTGPVTEEGGDDTSAAGTSEATSSTSPAGGAVPPTDGTASRRPVGSGPNAVLWLALGLAAVLLAPLITHWFRSRSARPAQDEPHPW